MLKHIPTIDNLYFVAVIALLTFWLTMITSKGGLTDERFSNFFEKFTKRGRKAIRVGFLIGVVLVLQEINNNNISNKKDNTLEAVQNNRDAKITAGIKKGVDASTENLFKNLSEAFKKQGLQYDTIRNEVKRIRDSVKVTTVMTETPMIGIDKLKIKDSTSIGAQTYTIEYTIKSYDAKSLNIDLKFDVFVYTNLDLIRTLKKNITFSYKGQNIHKEESLTSTFIVPKEKYYKHYAIRLKGSYYSSKNEQYFIDRFYLLIPGKQVDGYETPSQLKEDALRTHLVRYDIK